MGANDMKCTIRSFDAGYKDLSRSIFTLLLVARQVRASKGYTISLIASL